MKRLFLVPAAVTASLVLVACGSGDSSVPDGSGPWDVSNCAAPAPPQSESAVPEGAVVVGEVATTSDLASAPTIAVLEGAVPVTQLTAVDIVEGEGPEVVAGATVTVNYCGVGLSSGAIFDSSWARGTPATFPLDGVIQGWQEGKPGMKPGGRRLLIIPADKAYGSLPPQGSGIAPGESLVFVVDLVSSP